jgi:hypothetical protein
MLNLKQEELIRELVKDIQKQFPEVKFMNVTFSPENPNELWIRVTAPEDEDREIELAEYGANKTIDILTDYGYHMLVMPTHSLEQANFWSHVELNLEEPEPVRE